MTDRLLVADACFKKGPCSMLWNVPSWAVGTDPSSRPDYTAPALHTGSVALAVCQHAWKDLIKKNFDSETNFRFDFI